MDSVFTSERYKYPSYEYITKKREEFQAMLEGFANYMQLNKTDFKLDTDIIDDISTRLHQRRTYYLYFHGKELEQTRYAGIKAYWILRYRPLKSIKPWGEEYDENVYFAFYILFAATIVEYIPTIAHEKRRDVINRIRVEYEKDFLRSLNEYDIGKEAMMLVSESISNIIRFVITQI